MKVFTATLAVVLSLCLVATALPSANVPQSRGPQGLPGPGQSSPPVAQSADVGPSTDVPRSRGPQGLPGPGPSSPRVSASRDVVLPPADGRLSAFVIVLISVGATLALTGVAYSATRAVQHQRAVS